MLFVNSTQANDYARALRCISVCCDFVLISKPRTLTAKTCCKQWRKNRVSVPKSCETRNWPLAIFNIANARCESALEKKTWPRTESASASHPNCMLIAPADKQTRKWSESAGNFTFSHSVLRCANLNIYQAMTDAWVSECEREENFSHFS